MLKFQKIQAQDRVVNNIQDNLSKALNPISANPILNGQILQKVALASGANVVPHGLGRPLIGWYLVRNRANQTVYDTQDSNMTPQLNLQLTASGAMTVDIAVF